MSGLIGGIFNHSDKLQMESLNQRLRRSEVLSGNIANSETPGFRAIGYNFEEQLQAVADTNNPVNMRTTDGRHLRNAFTLADGQIRPEVFVRPTESIPEDGNTVDVDQEMGDLSKTQILYRATVDLLNRKIGMLRYAITNGGR